MPTVTFKAKPETIYNPDNTPAWTWVKVPKLSRSHCNMHEFRTHKRFGCLANSDMFPGILARAVKAAGVGDHIRLDQIPDAVTVDTSGFLAKISISLP